MANNRLKIIISGGGTGGHIFPAISIANALRELVPDIDILFVGAEGRMEMERVPKAGYPIVGLPVAGFKRSLSPSNLQVILKLIKSLYKARKLIKQFAPHAVVGVGGYASGPVLRAAQQAGIPTLIQEQNSYAGITNRLLAKKAKAICVAYDGMERYFPAGKIIKTGNPIRQDLEKLQTDRNEALRYFSIEAGQRVILIIGGSLGAGSINRCLLNNLDVIRKHNHTTLIWQTGGYYYNSIREKLDKNPCPNLRVYDFIQRMDYAYSAANLVISRAGAGTISELCIVKKPAILVPSPNVAEDHQTKNALALANRDAAIVIADSEADSKLLSTALKLVKDDKTLTKLSTNISELALPRSAQIIAQKTIDLINRNKTPKKS